MNHRHSGPVGGYSYLDRLDELVAQALADHEHHHGDDLSPLDALVRDLAVARHDAIRMRDHDHEWDTDGHCTICGRIGGTD